MYLLIQWFNEISHLQQSLLLLLLLLINITVHPKQLNQLFKLSNVIKLKKFQLKSFTSHD
jgi:hypothetical protein